MNSKGFTLVELAIVLVIIGVILGGVIKGQELVTNARTKQLYRDFQQVEFAFFSYFDRYNEVAGDATGTGSSGDNGLLDSGNSTSRLNTDVSGTELTVFWSDIRLAGFFNDGTDLSNASNSLNLPNHTFGGQMAVNSGQFGFTRNVLCMANLDGDVAQIFDAQFDNGIATSGEIRSATALASETPTEDYNTSASGYTTCLEID